MGDPRLHPTAIVAPGAKLAEGVEIGPYAVLDSDVEIGPGTRIGPHVVVHRFVRIGARNRVHAHAVLGDVPQDVGFDGRETWLEIGDDNLIRENVTMSRATDPGRPTRIGSGCFLMAGSHVAHDCALGDSVILTNNVLLAGHVQIGDRAVIGGNTGIHQFVRIGRLAMVGGMTPVRKDVLPYTMIAGVPARIYRLNTVGLRRAGVTGSRYRVLESAMRAMRTAVSVEALEGLEETEEIAHLREWLAAPSKRGCYTFSPGD